MKNLLFRLSICGQMILGSQPLISEMFIFTELPEFIAFLFLILAAVTLLNRNAEFLFNFPRKPELDAPKFKQSNRLKDRGDRSAKVVTFADLSQHTEVVAHGNFFESQREVLFKESAHRLKSYTEKAYKEIFGKFSHKTSQSSKRNVFERKPEQRLTCRTRDSESSFQGSSSVMTVSTSLQPARKETKRIREPRLRVNWCPCPFSGQRASNCLSKKAEFRNLNWKSKFINYSEPSSTPCDLFDVLESIRSGKAFYFVNVRQYENKYELLSDVREALIQCDCDFLRNIAQRHWFLFSITLKHSLLAWFFHELSNPFRFNVEGAEKSPELTMAEFLLKACDINDPYNGRTALEYTLRNFNYGAYMWVSQNGGKFSTGTLSIPVRSDAPIDADTILLFQNLPSVNYNVEKSEFTVNL